MDIEELEPRYRRILDEIAALRSSLERLEVDVVQLLRDYGVTWEAIGEGLDPPISRQAAARRFEQPRRRRRRS